MSLYKTKNNIKNIFFIAICCIFAAKLYTGNMKYYIKKYQRGNMVTAPELLVLENREKHWSENVPESWDWLKQYDLRDISTDVATDVIKNFEQFRSKTYKDGKGIPTIGYGTTDKKYVLKNQITEEEAAQALKNYLNTVVDPVLTKKSYYPNLGINQKIALKSLMYNIGPTQFNNSPKLQKALADGNWLEAVKQMNHGVNDKKNPGLATRRQFEQNLFKLDIQ